MVVDTIDVVLPVCRRGSIRFHRKRTDVHRSKRRKDMSLAWIDVLGGVQLGFTASGSITCFIFLIYVLYWDKKTRHHEKLRTFVRLYGTRLILLVAGFVWVSVQILWISVLWVPGLSYFGGIASEDVKILCNVYLLAGNGIAMPLFLFLCYLLVKTAGNSDQQTNVQILFRAALCTVPIAVPIAIIAWNEEIFRLNYRDASGLPGIWYQTYKVGNDTTCTESTCILCTFPLFYTIVTVLFVGVHLILLSFPAKRLWGLTLNQVMSRRLKFLGVLLYLVVPSSVVLAGVMGGLTPGTLAFQILAVVYILAICCITAGCSWVMAVEPEREAWLAAETTYKHGERPLPELLNNPS